MKNKKSIKLKVKKNNKKNILLKDKVKVNNTIVRQIPESSSNRLQRNVHLVRVVNGCSVNNLTFTSTEELNNYLFKFDQENYGKNPVDTGTWIDLIVTDIQGEIFDMEHLELDKN